MRTSGAVLLLALLALVFSTPVSAGTIDSFSNLDAIVTFDISPSTLAITVQNLRTVDATGNTLTAIRFAFEPEGAPVSLDLTSVDASEFYRCTGTGVSTVCNSSAPAPFTAPLYGWVAGGASPEFTLHPEGGFKPGAIVNSSIIENAGDGLGNAVHNPYLGGPVTFVLSGVLPAGAVLDRDSVAVHFGTGTDGWTSPDPVPEPASSLLVVLALIGLGWRRSRSV